MLRTVFSSPWLTFVLAAALAVSLAFNLTGDDAPTGPRALAFQTSGPELRPTLLVDFDADMVSADRTDELLEPGAIALDPPVALEARFVTARRLRIRPTVKLAHFTTFHVRFGEMFADLAGRPVDREASIPLSFQSSRFGLAEPPSAYVDRSGDGVVCDLEFNGAVRRAELEEHLRLESTDGADLPFRLEGEGTDWTLRPETVEGKGVVVVIAGDLVRSRGDTGDAPDRRYALTWPTTLRITGVRVRGSGRDRRVELRFSHHLAVRDATPYVQVTPPVADLSVEVRGRKLTLHGRFPPRRALDVRVLGGLPARQGLALAEDVSRVVRIPPVEPSLRVAGRGRTLSVAARPELEIEGVNVPAVEVTLQEVHPSNVVPLALRWRRAPDLARAPRRKRIAVQAPLDERWIRRLDLAAIHGSPPRGIYHVEIEDPNTSWTSDSRLLQVTDLAPLVRVRPDRLVVLLTRLSDGQPVAGAKVEAYDRKNQRVAEGETDEQGLLVVPAQSPFVVTVSTEDDRAYVDLRAHGLAHRAEEIEGRPPVAGLEAYVYSDRGVVRPGETCHIGALLRTPAGRAPADRLPVELRLRASDDRIVRSWTRRTNPHGVVALDVPFPWDAPTGPYRIELVVEGREHAIGRVAFRVESIVPDRIEPSLRLPTGELGFEDSVNVGIAAHLLTGRAAPGLRAKLSVRYVPEPATRHDGFAFGDPDAAPEPFRVELADVSLDEEGTARVQADLPASNPSGLPLRAVFELEVIDISGRAVFVREARRVVPTGPRLGLAVPVGNDLEVSLVAMDAERASGTAVLERLTWHGHYVYGHGGRRGPVWRSELVAHPVRERPFSLIDGRGSVRFGEVGDGRYRARIQAEGLAGAAVRFDCWNGTVEGSEDDGGAPRLDLQLLQESVAPGETARLRVDVPFAGRGLLTLEGPGTLEARVVPLTAGLQALDVEVPDAPSPNLHATLTLFRGAREAAGTHARLLGAVRIPLDRPERRLDVALDVPEQAVPGTELAVGLTTSHPASVRLHLVDEGVLRLTGYTTPDPLAFFEAPRRLDTRLADVWTTLLEGMRFPDDPEPGGGEGLFVGRLDPTARKTIETVALASALVPCDGETTIEFTLPEQYEGRLRVFAVAAGESSAGAASAPLVLEAPISVAVHTPRAVAPGDEFHVPIQIRGEGVAHEVTLDGLERVAESGPLVVRAMDRVGVASVVVHATDGAGNETIRRARLSVRPPAPYAVRHEVVRVDAGETETPLPGEWLTGHRRARLTVGAAGALRLLPALDRLLEYPHGCVEQTTSRAFPLLALSELARASHPEGEAPRDTVGACIDRVLSMQNSDGGLSTWPGGGSSYAHGSAYAAHFLLEAKRFGRAVPDRDLTALLDYLEGRLRSRHPDAYTARVLALGGRAVVPFVERLAEDAKRAEDVANLAAAYLLAGDRSRADAMLAKAGDPWAAPTRHGGSLDHPLRAAATLLSALVDVRPDDARVPELVERLTAAVQADDGHTTQTDAAILLALAKVHAAPVGGAVRGTLRVGDREYAFDDASGVVATVGADDPWRFGVSADGPVILVARTEGIPRNAPTGDLEHGIRVRRRIVAPDGPLRQGRVYEVVIEGRAPSDCENLLVTDVLPGGLEIEAARNREGSLEPDRVEPRDDRVLFFRTKPLRGEFRQTYLVRAVTAGRFHVPPVRAELLYAPAVYGRGSGGTTLEIVR